MIRYLRAPATLTFVALLWITGASTGPPAGAGSLEHWWTPLISVPWCGNLAGYLLTTALLLAVGPPAERRLGSWRAIGIFLAGQAVGTLAGAALVRLGAAADLWWYVNIEYEHALGPSVGIAGLAMALSFKLDPLWGRRIRVLGLVVLAMIALYIGSLEDILRLSGALTGLGLGRLLFGRSRPASSVAETRTLVATIVAASAVGPLLALITRSAFGPLTELLYLFGSPPADPAGVAEICAAPGYGAECHALQAMERASGLGPAITSVVPVLITVAVAEGLRRGRRFALWSALVFNVVLAALLVIDLLDAMTSPDIEFVDPAVGDRTAYLMAVGPLLLQPLALITLLLLTRRRFDVIAPLRTYRRFWLVVGVTFVLTATVDVLVGYLVRAEYSPAATLGQVLADLPARYLPAGYLFQDMTPLLPSGPVASILYDYTGAVFWTAALAAVLLTFWRPRLAGGQQDAARARALLRAHGGSSLSYMTMWPGNHYWFGDDARSAVAYRVAATVALTTGDPLGPAETHSEAFRGFAEFCRHNGWTACFYSVTENIRDIALASGWRAVQVAEDTVLSLPELTFTGKKWQDVRTARNNAGKLGITAEWCRFSDAPPAITDQVKVISDEWMAGKGLPELGFTLGGVAELADREVRCLIAVDADRTVHGIVSWLPVYREGRPIGWTLDFMRRRPGCFPGSMEFLIASSALHFREQGAEFLSLSGAPLARLDRGERIGPVQRILDRTGRALEPVYGFGSLLAFKAKFQPVYRPLYLIYQDPAALLTIANGVGRAYLPNLTPRQTLRLVGKLANR